MDWWFHIFDYGKGLMTKMNIKVNSNLTYLTLERTNKIEDGFNQQPPILYCKKIIEKEDEFN